MGARVPAIRCAKQPDSFLRIDHLTTQMRAGERDNAGGLADAKIIPGKNCEEIYFGRKL